MMLPPLVDVVTFPTPRTGIEAELRIDCPLMVMTAVAFEPTRSGGKEQLTKRLTTLTMVHGCPPKVTLMGVVK